MKPEKMKVNSILIIDDDIDDYELVAEAVRDIDPGITVSYFNSCEQARDADGNLFDLVFLDINMPKHDGFSWLKGIRERGHKKLPVVMYTNSMSPAHISRAYTEGANLYFSKPETYPGLLNGLRQIIGMDWSDPSSITRQYNSQGKFSTFQPSC
ncbi:MAG: response regulator [Chitinophagaceae bacterium]|nr:MAG: response regulator [Chitinophagaceae bacterium]